LHLASVEEHGAARVETLGWHGTLSHGAAAGSDVAAWTTWSTIVQICSEGTARHVELDSQRVVCPWAGQLRNSNCPDIMEVAVDTTVIQTSEAGQRQSVVVGISQEDLHRVVSVPAWVDDLVVGCDNHLVFSSDQVARTHHLGIRNDSRRGCRDLPLEDAILVDGDINTAVSNVGDVD